MRTTQFRELMELLDANIEDEDTLEGEPCDVFENLVAGARIFDDVPREEVEEAIRKWQIRNEQ